MQEMLQIAALAVVAAVRCVILRSYTDMFGMLLSLAGCVLVLVLALRFFSPILVLVEKLRALTGLADAVTEPVLKIVGIGILTQLSGSVCRDAGESSLAHTVELGGTILSLYASSPLMSAVLELMEEMLNG